MMLYIEESISIGLVTEPRGQFRYEGTALGGLVWVGMFSIEVALRRLCLGGVAQVDQSLIPR
jgi:hypothetical protein